MRNQKNTIIIGSILVLFFVLISYILGFNGLYGQDSYDYLRFTKALSSYFTSGTNPGSFFWPVNYPFFGAILSLFIPSKIFALQLLSYLSFVVSGVLLYKIIEIIFQASRKSIVVYLALFFLLSPYLLRGSLVIMSDMLALAFSLAVFLFVVKYTKTGMRIDFLFAIVFSFLAGFTRHHAFVILFVPMLYSLYLVLKRKDYLLLLYSILTALLVVFPTIWFKGNDFTNFTHHQWFTDWSPVNWFSNSFNTSDGQASYRFPNIIYGFFYLVHPGFIFPGLLLILFINKNEFTRLPARLLLAMIVLNGLFIAGIPFQNLRFHIIIFPFALILFFPAFLKLTKKVSTNNTLKITVIVLTVIIQTSLFTYIFQKFNSDNKLEKLIATTVGRYKGNPVYTFAIDQAINTYQPEKDIRNIWYNKYENFEPGSLFLFNEKKFKKQWEGKNPWINWQNVNKNYKLEILETLPGGWALYEIQ